MYYYFKKYIYYSRARIVSIKLKNLYNIKKKKKYKPYNFFYNSQKCLFNLIKKVSLNPDKLKRL